PIISIGYTASHIRTYTQATGDGLDIDNGFHPYLGGHQAAILDSNGYHSLLIGQAAFIFKHGELFISTSEPNGL
ncbi:hypothetical protein NX059_011591, partial [Plenodomus lindquistii]